MTDALLNRLQRDPQGIQHTLAFPSQLFQVEGRRSPEPFESEPGWGVNAFLQVFVITRKGAFNHQISQLQKAGSMSPPEHLKLKDGHVSASIPPYGLEVLVIHKR
jgi:hypothetical protein